MKKISVLLFSLITNMVFGAVFNIPNGDVVAFINAINTANSNGQADIINLAFNGTYDFSNSNNTVSGQPFGYTETEGPVALPIIANKAISGTDIVFNLNGATLRLVGTTKTRLFYSANGTTWQLNNCIIKDFESPINNPIANRLAR